MAHIRAQRNRELYADHLRGWSKTQLIHKYALSLVRINKIIQAERMRAQFSPLHGPLTGGSNQMSS